MLACFLYSIERLVMDEIHSMATYGGAASILGVTYWQLVQFVKKHKVPAVKLTGSNKEATTEKETQTDDLTLACYLNTEGVPLVRTYRDKESYRIFFVFDDQDGRVKRLTQVFYNSPDGKRAHDLIRQYRVVRSLAIDLWDGVRP